MTKPNSFNHEIRNPLFIARNLIENHLEKLEARPERNGTFLSRETKIVLKQTTKQIDRVLKVLQRVTSISQEKPTDELEERRKNRSTLRTVIGRVIETARSGGFLEGIHLVVSIPPDLPEVRMSRVEAEEVFYNLVSNAAQAMLQGGELAVKAKVDTETESYVTISVQDTGSGIPVEALKYIFEPFYTTRVDGGGSGFGLYIVKHLVERNRGTLTVQSHGHLGTTFTVHLPVVEVPQLTA